MYELAGCPAVALVSRGNTKEVGSDTNATYVLDFSFKDCIKYPSSLVYQPVARYLLRISFAVLGIVVTTQDFRRKGADTKVFKLVIVYEELMQLFLLCIGICH